MPKRLWVGTRKRLWVGTRGRDAKSWRVSAVLGCAGPVNEPAPVPAPGFFRARTRARTRARGSLQLGSASDRRSLQVEARLLLPQRAGGEQARLVERLSNELHADGELAGTGEAHREREGGKASQVARGSERIGAVEERVERLVDRRRDVGQVRRDD